MFYEQHSVQHLEQNPLLPGMAWVGGVGVENTQSSAQQAKPTRCSTQGQELEVVCSARENCKEHYYTSPNHIPLAPPRPILSRSLVRENTKRRFIFQLALLHSPPPAAYLLQFKIILRLPIIMYSTLLHSDCVKYIRGAMGAVYEPILTSRSSCSRHQGRPERHLTDLQSRPERWMDTLPCTENTGITGEMGDRCLVNFTTVNPGQR